MNEILGQENPYAAPVARVVDEAIEGLQAADRGTRLAATLLDGMSVFVCMIPLFASLPFADIRQGGGFGAAMGIGFVLFLVMAVGLIVWNCVLLARGGQTLAKKLLGIRVVRRDGGHCGLGRIFFARYLPMAVLGAVPLIGPIVTLVDALLIFRDDRRCLHDEIADTIVVRA